MIEKLSMTMYAFGIVFLIGAIILAIAAFVSAYNNEKEAAAIAKSLLGTCLFFSILLWFLDWLIS